MSKKTQDPTSTLFYKIATTDVLPAYARCVLIAMLANKLEKAELLTLCNLSGQDSFDTENGLLSLKANGFVRYNTSRGVAQLNPEALKIFE